MKKIKDLTVTVTYTVGLHDVEVSKKVYDDLNALADKGRETVILRIWTSKYVLVSSGFLIIFTKVTLMIGIMKLILSSIQFNN